MKLYVYILALATLLIQSGCTKSPEPKPELPAIVHQAHLTDGWYPQNPEKLTQSLDQYFANAQKYFEVPVNTADVKAIIVPHAGHFYSGLCAATAYQALRGNTTINRVIILSPAHTAFYNGIALPDYTMYRTVLGDIPVDIEACNILKKDSLFRPYATAHATEHAIEIQLPFLQKTLSSFSIVPLVVGHLTPEDPLLASKLLKKIITDKTLIVISSDFVHHGARFDYELVDKNRIGHVRLLDSLAIEALGRQSYNEFDTLLQQTNATICGREALKILLALLGRGDLGQLRATVGCYYTSPQRQEQKETGSIKKLFQLPDDTSTDSSVSYASMIYSTPQQLKTHEQLLTGYEKQALLTMVRALIRNTFQPKDKQLDERLLFPIKSPGLMLPAGAFVTLNTKQGELRGCIGRIMTRDPLYQTVAAMSLASAFNDTRFQPLTAQELDNVIIDITVLTPPHKVAGYQDIQIGKHGIILTKQGHSAVFLPQVARDNHWTIETTLEHLSRKAGLPADAWKQGCDFEVFEGFEIKED